MPKIAEIKEMDGEVWVRVGQLSGDGSVAIREDAEVEKHAKEHYQAGLEAAARVCDQYGAAARNTHRYFEQEGKDDIAATWNGGATACEQLAEDIRALAADKTPTDRTVS